MAARTRPTRPRWRSSWCRCSPDASSTASAASTRPRASASPERTAADKPWHTEQVRAELLAHAGLPCSLWQAPAATLFALKSAKVKLDAFVGKKVIVTAVKIPGYPLEGGPDFYEVTAVEVDGEVKAN